MSGEQWCAERMNSDIRGSRGGSPGEVARNLVRDCEWILWHSEWDVDVVYSSLKRHSSSLSMSRVCVRRSASGNDDGS